ncbi:MAG: hypothetical protein B7733_24930 [Myxococcales bacterium FL481]|nr:MAG: hypothetical protein B7733_24930 [Myxococcales bacterium FL481]
MSTHWFHDHMLDFTAQNVYKGNVAMSNYYSSVDRGNESINDGVNLRLPSGSALDWGNRDYDVNLLISDKAWDSDGQLWFNPFNLNGFIGDHILTNWQYHPYFDVRARRYRFRILNGSVSRYFKIALVDETGNPVPFHMVANDGNIMEHAVHFADGTLPTQGIAERYDIVVDFSNFAPGDKLYFVNLLSHKDGQVTDQAIPLADVLDGTYAPIAVDTNNDGTPDEWQGGDPAVGKFLEFRVAAYNGQDNSMNPANYVEGGNTMIPLRRPSAAEIAAARHRNFEFEKNPTDEAPWVIETDGGKGVGMDPRRVSAAPQLACDPSNGPCAPDSGTLEIWRLVNGGNWSHPVHIHFEEGIILRRDNDTPPPHEKWARKDLYRIGPQPDSGAVVEIALRFREFAGTFMEHCHNTQHEDHAMLLRWDIEHPGQTAIMPTPMPTWDGVEYAETVALPTFRTGDGTGYGPPLEPMVVWAEGAEVGNLDFTSVGGLVNWTDKTVEGEGNDERGTITMPLQVAVNEDDDGNETDVYFFVSEVSDEDLAAQFGVGYMGALDGAGAPPAGSVSPATYTNDTWRFFGDLPNPIPTAGDNSPAQDQANTYTPVREVIIGGETVYFNIAFVAWGDDPWEKLRIDTHCTFPDNPASQNCRYQGKDLGTTTAGQIVALDLGADPTVTFKLHKAWFNQEYLPYYTITDAWPCGPANGMGVICVPKHAALATAARPLIQFLPQTAFVNRSDPHDGTGFPPTQVAFNVDGGGPLGGQPGVPSYFMPGPDYSPLWHIGFSRWNEAHPDMEQVTSYEELLAMWDDGRVSIFEFPPSPDRIGGITAPQTGDYDLESPTPAHVVNCPVPATLDVALLRASRMPATP